RLHDRERARRRERGHHRRLERHPFVDGNRQREAEAQRDPRAIEIGERARRARLDQARPDDARPRAGAELVAHELLETLPAAQPHLGRRVGDRRAAVEPRGLGARQRAAELELGLAGDARELRIFRRDRAQERERIGPADLSQRRRDRAPDRQRALARPRRDQRLLDFRRRQLAERDDRVAPRLVLRVVERSDEKRAQLGVARLLRDAPDEPHQSPALRSARLDERLAGRARRLGAEPRQQPLDGVGHVLVARLKPRDQRRHVGARRLHPALPRVGFQLIVAAFAPRGHEATHATRLSRMVRLLPSPDTDKTPPEPVDTFGKYQLIRRLGAGGMAEVFLAREPLAQGLAKILVIKKIHPSLAETPQFRQMFEDEAKVAVNLNHPNIVQTFGYGLIKEAAGPTFYLAMEHVEGIDLLRLLNCAVEAGRRIPFGLCAYLGQQIAKGLDYAHRKVDEYGEPLGIVHRDISPQNVLVTWDGMVKIVDFGIARARHVREVEGVVKGKFAYMSPEQAAGEPVDPRSDIFSTGIVLWELCCQRSLFGHLKGRQALNAVKNAQVSRPRQIDPTVPEELEAIILRALARRPEERFQTARDLHRALGKFFFELSAREGGAIYESGGMAQLIA